MGLKCEIDKVIIKKWPSLPIFFIGENSLQQAYEINYCAGGLNGHCHGNFAVIWSKLPKYLTKNPFPSMKLLLEHREENIKRFSQGRTSYCISNC